MLVKVDSIDKGAIGYNFNNGVRLSVIFKDMSYSDNYDLWKSGSLDDYEKRRRETLYSTTVEIMQTEGNPALNAWIHRKYGSYDGGNDPIGYVPVKHLPAILKRADSKVYANYKDTE